MTFSLLSPPRLEPERALKVTLPDSVVESYSFRPALASAQLRLDPWVWGPILTLIELRPLRTV